MSPQDNTSNAPSQAAPDDDIGARDAGARDVGARDAHNEKARRIYERAMEHHRAGRIEDAVKDYARVVRLSPLSADVYNNLGVALRMAGRPYGAVACYRRSLALKPGVAGVYTNLGNALRDLGENVRALEAHRRAVKAAPKSPKALFNAALAMRDVGQTKAALEDFSRAIKLEPTYTLCRVEHAITLLQLGEWQRGFKELDIRFTLKGRDPRRKDIPVWNGAPLQDKTILINYEGTEGRVIQFARFASALKHMGARVIIEAPAHMAHLLDAAPDIDKVIHPGETPKDVDVQIPLLSLPARLGLTPDNVPADIRYLSVPKFAQQSLDIHPLTRLAVGLVWSGTWDGRIAGAPPRGNDMMLEDFEEIFGLPGLQFFALERGAGAGDIARLGLQGLVEHTGASVMDLSDLAGFIDQLDLIICVDGPAAHIAAALGTPVWMLTGPGADWSWLLDRDDSPWYPSLRLFRRGPNDQWRDTVTHVRQALTDVLREGES